MKQYEYKIISIAFEEKEDKDEKILSSLNEQGKSGWLVCSLNVEARINDKEQSIKVLLVREKSKRQKTQALEDAAGDEEFVDEVIKKINSDPI